MTSKAAEAGAGADYVVSAFGASATFGTIGDITYGAWPSELITTLGKLALMGT